jgi:hypothetical protein
VHPRPEVLVDISQQLIQRHTVFPQTALDMGADIRLQTVNRGLSSHISPRAGTLHARHNRPTRSHISAAFGQAGNQHRFNIFNRHQTLLFKPAQL